MYLHSDSLQSVMIHCIILKTTEETKKGGLQGDSCWRIKEELIQYAKEIGVDKIRFASADTFDSLKDRLILHESLGYFVRF